MRKLHYRSSHSAPYKPHEVGTRKHFFGSKLNKSKRFMIFNPKKGGQFFDIFAPHLPHNLKKWVSSGGSRGSGPKIYGGMHLLDKIMILQGVKQMIQPLEVGYANSPRKAQGGGGVTGVFPDIRACVASI